MQHATDIMQHATSRPGETAVAPTLHAMPWPCHAMLATRTGAASTSTLVWHKLHGVQCTSYAAVYGMHAERYRLHAARMHATSSVQHAAWLHACWRPGPALRASARLCRAPCPRGVPGSVPFYVTGRVHASLRAACSRLELAPGEHGACLSGFAHPKVVR